MIWAGNSTSPPPLPQHGLGARDATESMRLAVPTYLPISLPGLPLPVIWAPGWVMLDILLWASGVLCLVGQPRGQE